MRIAAVSLAVAVALGSVIVASATGGLPQLGQLQAGPYSVTIYNDSPKLVTGRNVLTLELPGDVAPNAHLELIDPKGIARTVHLQNVSVWGGAEPGHGGDMAGMPGMAGMDHGTTAVDPHGGHSVAPAAPAPIQPLVQQASPMSVRGAVDLPSGGTWTARVTVSAPDGESYSAERVLDVADGGPNRVYLVLTGATIVIALAIGTVARQRARVATVVAK